MTSLSGLAPYAQRLSEFTRARGWSETHDPKSLLLALVGEVGELAEIFQWMSAATASDEATTAGTRERVEDELADVLIYLIHLANRLEIDLDACLVRKMTANEVRFPPTAT